MTMQTTVLTVGVSDSMKDRLREAECHDRGFRLMVAEDERQAMAALGSVGPQVMVVNLSMSPAAALALSDYAAYRRPDTRIIYEMGGEGADALAAFTDGSIFGHSANAHGCVTPSLGAADMAAVVAHHAAELHKEVEAA